jgi:phosphinothricin acetyltransferase
MMVAVKMESACLIRSAEDKDLPGILAIYNQVIAHSTAIFSSAPVDLAERKAWLEMRRGRGFPVLVAVEAEDVLGFASYGDWRAASGYVFTVEHSIHVREGRRGAGIGSALMTALLREAEAQGKHAMIGGIDASNEASIAFHRSLGFDLVGRLGEVGHKFGRWLDLVFMQKRLDDRRTP